MFGGSLPPELDLVDRLALLDEFSTAWDYRGQARARSPGRVHSQDAAGAVRWLIPRLSLPASRLERIAVLASELGLTGESAPHGKDFDHILVIGGGRYTNLLRVSYARGQAPAGGPLDDPIGSGPDRSDSDIGRPVGARLRTGRNWPLQKCHVADLPSI